MTFAEPLQFTEETKNKLVLIQEDLMQAVMYGSITIDGDTLVTLAKLLERVLEDENFKNLK